MTYYLWSYSETGTNDSDAADMVKPEVTSSMHFT